MDKMYFLFRESFDFLNDTIVYGSSISSQSSHKDNFCTEKHDAEESLNSRRRGFNRSHGKKNRKTSEEKTAWREGKK